MTAPAPASPSDLDLLMAAVAEINAKPPTDLTDLDLDRLIAYHRHNRARRAAGHKLAKPEKPSVDVLSLINAKTTPTLAPGSVRRPK